MSTQIPETTLAALTRIQAQLQVRGEGRSAALAAAAAEMDTLRAGAYSEHPSVLLVRSHLGHARGDREETIAAATALRERTSSPGALTAATRALMASSAFSEAALTAARGLQLAPKDATLRTLAVDACSRQSETHAEGAAHLDVLLAQVEDLPDKERAAAHLAAARLAAAIGADEASRGHLEWVRALAPTHPSIAVVERQLAEAAAANAEKSSTEKSSTEASSTEAASTEAAGSELAAGTESTGDGEPAPAKKRGRRRPKDAPAAVVVEEEPAAAPALERPKMPGWCWVLCVGYLLLSLGAGLGAALVLPGEALVYDSELQIVLSAAALASAIQIVLAREILRGSGLSRSVVLLLGLLLIGVQVVDTAATQGVYQIVNGVVGAYAVLLVVLLSSRWFTLSRGVRVSKVLLVAIGVAALVVSLAGGLVLARAPEVSRELVAGVLTAISDETEAPVPVNVRPPQPLPAEVLSEEKLTELLVQPATLAPLGGSDAGMPAGAELRSIEEGDAARTRCYGSDPLRAEQLVLGSRVTLDEGAVRYAIVESRGRELRRAEAEAVLDQLAQEAHGQCSQEGDVAGFRAAAPTLSTPVGLASQVARSPRAVENRSQFTFEGTSPLQVRVINRYTLQSEEEHIVLRHVRITAVNYPTASLEALRAATAG